MDNEQDALILVRRPLLRPNNKLQFIIREEEAKTNNAYNTAFPSTDGRQRSSGSQRGSKRIILSIVRILFVDYVFFLGIKS